MGQYYNQHFAVCSFVEQADHRFIFLATLLNAHLGNTCARYAHMTIRQTYIQKVGCKEIFAEKVHKFGGKFLRQMHRN